ncbi:MAG: UDP-N-acetylmuramoyl-L-alanine--D-glutamate ligase [Candidatus Saccharibacteria bacterium]|nr:UDP-N-acetylmuramoyl-L-alanine--D-glutamate ligase [Candidatus Saccharibacteria bacterium]
MKILLLGYGKEGQAIETYFKQKDPSVTFDIWQNLTPDELKQRDYSLYDIIFRSPSVPPLGVKHESSVTRYFFEHCPCQIIGVTATKGKGTTCSFIKSLLDVEGEKAYLVGNIGEPAINVLDKLDESSIVVYEMSSFQLWDLPESPHISVIGTIEPDHLNVHHGYDDYIGAKANICRYQTSDDFCIYYKDNPESVKIAETAKNPVKIPYPFDIPDSIKNAIKLPGEHNIRNAIAAIAAVACYKNISPDEYIKRSENSIIQGLSHFTGLPHRLEFVREINGIRFYDDNFSTNPSSLKVAVDSFPHNRLVVIAGGRDKTGNADLEEIYQILKSPQVSEMVLIGESGQEIAHRHWSDPNLFWEETLEEAVNRAYALASSYQVTDDFVILMSPSAASFDMFKDVYDRGEKYQKLVENLE